MLPKTNLADFLKIDNKIKDDYNFKQWFGGLDDWFDGLDDTGSLKWIKQVRLSDGCSDPKKLAVLGQLMTGLVKHSLREKLVRDTANLILKQSGEHFETITHRHRIKNENGQLSDEPVYHKHHVLCKGVRSHDNFGEIESIMRWCQPPNIRYAYDPHNVEYFVTPRRAIIDKIRGLEGLDCDDKSMLFCSLMASIGYPSAIVISNPKGPGHPFSHAQSAIMSPSGKPMVGWYKNKKIIYPPNRWIPIELTIVEDVGFLADNADKFMFFPIR